MASWHGEFTVTVVRKKSASTTADGDELWTATINNEPAGLRALVGLPVATFTDATEAGVRQKVRAHLLEEASNMSGIERDRLHATLRRTWRVTIAEKKEDVGEEDDAVLFDLFD